MAYLSKLSLRRLLILLNLTLNVNFSWQFYFLSADFWQKLWEEVAEEIIVHLSFWCLTWCLNWGLSSNKPTDYLLDYGDFKPLGQTIKCGNRRYPNQFSVCTGWLMIACGLLSFQSSTILLYSFTKHPEVSFIAKKLFSIKKKKITLSLATHSGSILCVYVVACDSLFVDIEIRADISFLRIQFLWGTRNWLLWILLNTLRESGNVISLSSTIYGGWSIVYWTSGLEFYSFSHFRKWVKRSVHFYKTIQLNLTLNVNFCSVNSILVKQAY